MLFPIGKLVATPGALEILGAANESPFRYLYRHANGDWGVVCDEDKCYNDDALKTGGRLLSAYTTPGGNKLWVITEADRSVTTILLPEEY